jgi:hypothetical protein
MAKRKTKRNAGRLQHPSGFKICKDPMVRLTEDEQLSHYGDRMGLPRVCGPPFLFAIARDSRTIFASWTIDWRSVFENGIPADRQVHLRVIGKNGVIETRVAVEPMSTMHYLTISGLHDSYRVEIGYFRPFDVDLVTIPFHLGFQELANLFGAADASVARALSAFQKRILSDDGPNETTRFDARILRDLNLSLPELATAERDYEEIDTEKLIRRARGMLRVTTTSPVRGFQANPGS